MTLSYVPNYKYLIFFLKATEWGISTIHWIFLQNTQMVMYVKDTPLKPKMYKQCTELHPEIRKKKKVSTIFSSTIFVITRVRKLLP